MRDLERVSFRATTVSERLVARTSCGRTSHQAGRIRNLKRRERGERRGRSFPFGCGQWPRHDFCALCVSDSSARSKVSVIALTSENSPSECEKQHWPWLGAGRWTWLERRAAVAARSDCAKFIAGAFDSVSTEATDEVSRWGAEQSPRRRALRWRALWPPHERAVMTAPRQPRVPWPSPSILR